MMNAPQQNLPQLSRTQAWLLPLVDRFMALMLSRPASGSLRTTKVTAATICLSLLVVLLTGIPGILLIPYGIGRSLWWLVLVGLVAAGLGLGSACLAIFGLLQRRAIASAPSKR